MMLAKQELASIITRCTELDYGLKFVLLPPRTDVDEYARQKLAESTGWTAAQLNVNKALGDSLQSWLLTQNQYVLRLDSALSNALDPMYWETDDHLGIYGHQVVAKTLMSTRFQH